MTRAISSLLILAVTGWGALWCCCGAAEAAAGGKAAPSAEHGCCAEEPAEPAPAPHCPDDEQGPQGRCPMMSQAGLPDQADSVVPPAGPDLPFMAALWLTPAALLPVTPELATPALAEESPPGPLLHSLFGQHTLLTI